MLSYKQQSGYLLKIVLSLGTFFVVPSCKAQEKPSFKNIQKPTLYQEFDIMIVKDSRTSGGVTDLNADNLSLFAKNVSLKMLIAGAYGIREGRIFGLPKWAEEAKWDVQAKVSDPDAALAKITPSPPQALDIYRLHVRSILENCFQLQVHSEIRSGSLYRLTIAPGKLKVKSTMTPVDEQGITRGRGQISAEGITMAELADELSISIGRDVIDNTKLEGKFDIQLRWLPDEEVEHSQEADSRLPLLTAIQEQLGLKLMPAMGDFSVIKVDSVHRPNQE